MAKIESEAAELPAMEIEKGTVVCEPMNGPRLFVVMGPGQTAATVLLAPLNVRQRRKRALWYYAFAQDLERLPNEEKR